MMIKKCLVCGKNFDTTKIGRYKYCSEKCAKSGNKKNYLRDISTLRFNEPMQVDLEGDGYADGELVYDYGKCPKCGWEFEEGDKDWEQPYCCHCGQKLKWFENEAESEPQAGSNECMLSDYPDMPNQFDNMTGSMNV